MQHKLVPFNEKLRLSALQEYAIINSGTDKDYDELTFLAATICEVPISKVSIIDKDRIWNKSVYGTGLAEINRENSFCDQAINSDSSLVIYNSEEHPKLFEKAEEVYKEKYKFYAGVPLYNPQGHAIAVFCIFDTEIKTLTNTQKKALKSIAKQALNLFEFRKQKNKLYHVQNKLKEKYRELEKFASLVSHDLKSPLANIISLSELLEEENKGKFDEETEKYLEFLIQSSYSLRNYIDGILGFYKSDHILERDFENVDLHKLLKGIVDLFQVSDDIEILYPDDVMLHNVNKAALTQIFMNLISNALKYNDKKIRKVEISFSKSDGYYSFEVKDNGKGIPRDKFKEIFEIFTTLDAPDRDGNPGSGIGLATVNKHIENMHGKISLESELGTGSVFKFRIRRL